MSIYTLPKNISFNQHYLNRYIKFINNCVQRCAPEGYTETHHIVPKCIGGTDEPENLVKLTAREHFIAHWLLYKIYRTSKLAHAWNNMCIIKTGQEERKINSKHFEKARIAHSTVLSKSKSGENHHFFGKNLSEEHKHKISLSLKGKSPSEETRLKLSLAKKGKPKSQETKAKISETKKNRPYKHSEASKLNLSIKLTGRIFSEEHKLKISLSKQNVSDETRLKLSLNNKNRKKVLCPYCNRTFLPQNIPQFHGENCKQNPKKILN